MIQHIIIMFTLSLDLLSIPITLAQLYSDRIFCAVQKIIISPAATKLMLFISFLLHQLQQI